MSGDLVLCDVTEQVAVVTMNRPAALNALSDAMLAAMQTDLRDWPGDARSALDMLPAGHAFTVPEVLFAKIADEQRDEWQDRFKGIRG